MKLKNTGAASVRVYLAPDKRLRGEPTKDYCLKVGEEREVTVSGGGVSIYLASEDMRQMVAKVLQRERGRTNMATVLKKENLRSW